MSKRCSEPAPYAHNLVSSLYAMRGRLEMLLEAGKQDEARRNPEAALENAQKMIEEVYLQAGRALSLTRRLGGILSAKETAPEKRTAPVLSAWRAARGSLEKEYDLHRFQFLERVPDGFPRVRCLPEELKEILYHLTANALQALERSEEHTSELQSR